MSQPLRPPALSAPPSTASHGRPDPASRAAGRYYTRLGNLCIQTGERARALTLYGRGIDAYLAAGELERASNLCRKVIALAPEVIRARCTLAFVSLGRGEMEAFERELSEYVSAARQGGKEEYAAARIRMVGSITHDPDARMLLARALLELGDVRGSAHLLDALQTRRDGHDGHATQQGEKERERWLRLLRVLLSDPSARECSNTIASSPLLVHPT